MKIENGPICKGVFIALRYFLGDLGIRTCTEMRSEGKGVSAAPNDEEPDHGYFL